MYSFLIWIASIQMLNLVIANLLDVLFLSNLETRRQVKVLLTSLLSARIIAFS
jgi:hypothetical protein